MEKIITRFAPSPTGFMHIGSLRTALFAYLWARKNNGTFILRIEDTDKEREVEGSIEHIQNSLKWIGIDWDYGPDKPGPFGSCIQSERISIHREYADKLIAKGLAYPDPYTPAEIEKFRAQAIAEKRPFLYRDHRPEKFEKWDGTKPLRLKVPTIKRSSWHDVVRGDLEAGEEMLDDFILIKSDGYPTYNFAHIVDDHVMGVTHILRADEFISSTPRFLSLYEALEITPPIFVTLPPILREDRTKKLGKRDGAKDVMEYKKEGYLPEALANYLALLGWHPSDDREIFTMQDLAREITLERIQKSGAVFDEDKLDWVNRQHLMSLDDRSFLQRAENFIPKDLDNESLYKSLSAVREKISCFKEIGALFADDGELAFVRKDPIPDLAMLVWKKEPSLESAHRHLSECGRLIDTLDEASFTIDNIKSIIWPYAEANGKGNVLWPLRVALTGQERSPDPFASAAMIGKRRSSQRISEALTAITRAPKT
jgi:glutamyl-tRNA synthetase